LTAASQVRTRIESIDVLRGIVMILMALDHVRDYFGTAANPTDPARATAALFFTRWITHLCAPTFFLLTGTGAYLAGRRRTTPDLSRFLFVRGIWLIGLELTVLRCLAYQFNVDYRVTMLIILWALGWSMIVLAALVHLPTKAVAFFGIALIVAHNLFDGVRASSLGAFAPLWSILHAPNVIVSKAPARSVTRSVFIAAPVIALMFVLGTSTVVAYVPNNAIDLIGPVAQVLRVGYGPFGIAMPLVTTAILMTLAMRIGQASVAFTAVTRLPMVAGWDHMLPAWFSRLHATYRTPMNSIMLVGAASFGIAAVSLIGVGQAEAFQLVFNASGIFYALTYVVMFALPLFGLRTVTPRPPTWLRLTSLSGLLMTVLYIVLSVFPIIDVESVSTFALKITMMVVAMNLVGIGILLSAGQRSAAPAEKARSS